MSYSLEDFEPYTLRKSMDKLVVLAWSKQNGYQFMSLTDRVKAMADGLDFNIIAVEKDK